MKLKLLYILVQSLYFQTIVCDETTPAVNEVSILAMGLSGAGVFSTVNNLISKQAEKSQSENPVVTEYSWYIELPNQTDCRVRIAVSPGQIEGKTPDYDSKTLSSIKEYIKSDSGLQGRFPSIVLVIARFDDTRPEGSNAHFVKMLKNVQMIKNELGYSTKKSSNLIFLLTRLMSRSKQEARRPNATIANFGRIIKSNSDFPDPIIVTVGENLPDDYDLKTNGWFIHLPNRQSYPNNVIHEMLKILLASDEIIAHEILREAFKDPNTNPIPPPTIQTFSSNSTSFSQNIIGSSFAFNADSDISKDLQLAYESLDENMKRSHPAILQLVQLAFHRENITTRDELPKTILETVKLFQKLPFNSATLALVEKAFNLEQPSFIHPTIVGYGYDVLKDTVVGKSPFILENIKSTPIGYSLPDIYTCSIKEKEELVENFEFIESYDDFKRKRLENLKIPINSVNSSVFTGAVRSSFNNVKPESDAFITLTAIQQIQNFELNLISSSLLDEQFVSDVNELTPFKQTERESEKEWKAFFGKYGTHVVTKAFGGGYMEGKASGDAIEKNLAHRNLLEDVKKTLISFQNLPENIHSGELQMSHTFFGGAPDAEMANIASLSTERREKLFDAWKMSVKSEPRIMDTDIELIPLSDIVGFVDKAKGQEIKNSLDRFLAGNLYYIRKRSNRTQTVKPKPANNRSSTIQRTTTTRKPSVSSNTNSIRTVTKKPYEYQYQSQYYNPIIATTTNNPCPPEEKCDNNCEKIQHEFDKADNIIAQGYNVLQDSILATSPFLITMQTISGKHLPEGVSVREGKDKPCAYSFFEEMKDYNDYAKHKLLILMDKLQPDIKKDIRVNVSSFQGSVKPGYNLVDETPVNGPFSIYKDIRYAHVNADFKNLTLSKDFITAVNLLKSYNNDTEDCSVHEEWLNFFENYGTHFVKSGYWGTWKEIISVGGTMEDMNSTYGSVNNKCNTIKGNKVDHSISPGVLTSSLKYATLKKVLEKFSDQFEPNHIFVMEYDDVMKALFENRLKRC